MAQPGPIEVDSEAGFEDRWAKAKAVIFVVLGLLILAGLAGVFGRGPLSKGEAHAGAARITWERFARANTPGKFEVELESPAAAQTVQVSLDRPLADGLKVNSTQPRAVTEQATANGVNYLFQLAADRRGRIAFSVEPSHMGPVRGSVDVDGMRTNLNLFVWP
jgi:hypothetical protein